MSDYCKLIKSPVITEKSSMLQEKYNKYAIYVDVKCNKKQIKFAIKKVLNVDVLKLNIMNISGKKKRFKGIVGRRDNRKKVYFSIPAESSLSMLKV